MKTIQHKDKRLDQAHSELDAQFSEHSYIERLSKKIREKGGEDAQYEFSRWSNYYIMKSSRNKRWYYWLTYVVASLSGIVAIVSSINAVVHGATAFDVLIIAISSLSTVISVVLSTTHPQENWIRFRKYAMKIETEANRFVDGVDEYAIENCKGYLPEDYCYMFKENLIKIVQSETDKWIELMNIK